MTNSTATQIEFTREELMALVEALQTSVFNLENGDDSPIFAVLAKIAAVVCEDDC